MEKRLIFYPQDRMMWRKWLAENHATEMEVWIQRFNKASGKPCISYDELVEECLCFGWIDGVVNKYDVDSTIQRITPRRKKTFLSELNRQRIWKLERLGLMTEAGYTPIREQIGSPDDAYDIPEWITEQLRMDVTVWANFQAFPPLYKRLKIGWITECAKSRQDESQRRLNHLIKMTGQGKMYGTIPYMV